MLGIGCPDRHVLPRIMLSKMRRPRRVLPSRASGFVLRPKAVTRAATWLRALLPRTGHSPLPARRSQEGGKGEGDIPRGSTRKPDAPIDLMTGAPRCALRLPVQHADAAQRICRYRCTMPMRGGFTGAVQKPQNAERELQRAGGEGEPPLVRAAGRSAGDFDGRFYDASWAFC
jgi:hypothetical protein